MTPLFNRSHWRQQQQRAAPNAQQHDFLWRIVQDELSDRLHDIKRQLPVVLQCGGPENMLRPLADHKNITQLVHTQAAYIDAQAVMDDDAFAFADNSFDAIIAPLSLHTINDVPGALIQLHQGLKPDGVLLAALIGGASLHELRQIFMETEIALMGGASPRVYPMIDLRDAAGLLQRAGFALPVADHDTIDVTYRDLYHLMQDIRGMGGSNCLVQRYNRFTPRRFFAHAADLYAQRFPAPHGGITACFEIIYLTGWRPHHSQPQPLKRGSATINLASVMGRNSPSNTVS